MKCLITAGPTYEPVDRVRRLTNRSTGRLGVGLANYLAGRGHGVDLLLGEMSVFRAWIGAVRCHEFTTGSDLAAKLEAWAGKPVDAVFHAAAVSDFAVGLVGRWDGAGRWCGVKGEKIATQGGAIWMELQPTPKVINRLKEWFPDAWRVGWKYEVDGDRQDVVAKAERQIRESGVHACVGNGPAYGDGFAWVIGAGAHRHLNDAGALYKALEEGMRRHCAGGTGG